MIKVKKIINVKPYLITCEFNDGLIKTIDIKGLLNAHKHLQGIEKLYDESCFKKVYIGKFGEIVWDNIINTFQNGEENIWNYDISPEFAYNLPDIKDEKKSL